VRLPLVSDPTLTRVTSAVEAAFERISQYAVVPPGGTTGSVLVKADARDFNTAWATASDTAANIAAIASTINTTGKYAGRLVYDTTNHRLMVADGATAASLWYRADGAASVTPA
jgi:hypothetical protein